MSRCDRMDCKCGSNILHDSVCIIRGFMNRYKPHALPSVKNKSIKLPPSNIMY